MTFNGAVDLGAGLRTIRTGSGGPATFAGAISGSGGLSIQSHTLSADNTFTGGLTVFGDSTIPGSNAYAGTTLIAGHGLTLNGNGRIANSSAYDVRATSTSTTPRPTATTASRRSPSH